MCLIYIDSVIDCAIYSLFKQAFHLSDTEPKNGLASAIEENKQKPIQMYRFFMKFKQSCKSGYKFPSFFSNHNGFFAQINTKCAEDITTAPSI